MLRENGRESSVEAIRGRPRHSIDTVALLACQPLPGGNRVAIISNTGGAAALAADARGDHGLQVVQLGAATRRKLRRLLPPRAVPPGRWTPARR